MLHPSPLLVLLADSSATQAGRAIGTVIGVVLVALLCLGVPAFLIVSIIKYSRTKAQGWLIATILSGVMCLIPIGLVLAGFAIGVSRGLKESREGSTPLAADRSVESSDGAVRLRAAEHWRILSDLNDEAVLQVGNAAREEYLIVISDSKIDYSGTLADFAETTSESIMEFLDDAHATDMRKIKVNGRDALRREISGRMDAINIDYHFTAVESSDGYHQIMAWTTRSKKPTAFKVFDGVVASCELR